MSKPFRLMASRHLRKLIFIICGWLILQPCVAMKAKSGTVRSDPTPQETSYLSTEDALAQVIKYAKFGTQPNTDLVVDTGISIISVGFPPAGLVLGFAKQFVLSGSGNDPLGDALKAINAHLAELDQRLDKLEKEIKAIRNQQYQDENLARIRHLRLLGKAVEDGKDQLGLLPTSNFDKQTIANQAGTTAGLFLDDPDLWKWSDLHVKTVLVTDADGKKHNELTTDGLLAPDFEPIPTFEYYAGVLALWISALEYASGGDPKYVTNNKTLVNDLLRHAAFLSIRPTWHEADSLSTPDPPQNLPEEIMRRVNCYVEPVSKYPTNGVCNAARVCEDGFRRTRTTVDTMQFSMPSNNTLCTLSMPRPKAVPAYDESRPLYGSNAIALWQSWHAPIAVAKEDELEQGYGIEAMTLLADRLERLAKFGTTREQFIGTFGTTPVNYRPAFVYAIANNGNLLWYRQETNASKWSGPRQVGNGWKFKDVIPAGGNSFYALAEDGTLKWYRHDGFNDGSVAWKGPVDVGSGWNFAKIFSGGDGLVYAIKNDGTLLWYRHDGFADGGGVNTWEGPKVVGSSWLQFKHVFSGGQGIIYAVKPDGQMLWYRHDGYATGDSKWTGPLTVGSGWQNFSAIIPVGDGIILAINNDGKMLWYKHTDYATGTSGSGDVRSAGGLSTSAAAARAAAGARVSGTPHWEGPTEIGSGWQGFQKVIALIPSTPVGPR